MKAKFAELWRGGLFVVGLAGAAFALSAQERKPAESVPVASQAQLSEVLAKLTAAEAGSTADRARLQELVAAVAADPDLPEYERFVVASRARGVAIKETAGLTRAQRLGAYEQSARAMIAQFSDQAEPYEALLALANDQPNQVAGEKLARELLTMKAPAAVQAGAQRLLDRVALVGQAVPATLANRTGDSINLAQFRGKTLVLYAWSGAGARSHLWVRQMLSQCAGSDLVFVGLNFDLDRKTAEAKAAEVAVDWPQLFDPDGLKGQLAEQLKISRVPTVYLVDSEGIVREVRGWEHLSQKLAKLMAGKGGRS